MDPRLLNRYNEELHFIREMGVEFSKRFPKIGARLDLAGMDCADPYVERLLEGFAFLTARIRVKMDAEFPRFTQHLLENIYPHYLSPTPSMAIVEFEPDLKGGVTETGFVLPKNMELRSAYSRKGRVNCSFRTAHEVNLWPIKIVNAEYLSQTEAGHYAGQQLKGVKSAIRLKLETVAGFNWAQLCSQQPDQDPPGLNRLSFYLKGTGEIATELYELLIGHALLMVAGSGAGQNKGSSHKEIHHRHIKAQGFADNEALFPYGPASFTGYRYLQEYFSLPERFLFVELTGLDPVLRNIDGNLLEIIILLDEARPALNRLIDKHSFALNCTPAINLFEKRTDRIHLDHKSYEHHLLVDRTRPRDYEVYSVKSLTGFGSGSAPEQTFRPLYASTDSVSTTDNGAYYTVRRQPALAGSNRSLKYGLRSDYLGSEVFLALVDANEAPYRSDLKQLGALALCTNRDLAQFISPGQGKTDFTLEIGAPVNSVRCLAGPTDPKASYPEGEYNWRLINHLSTNYLTLQNNDQGAEALRQLLTLYGDFSEAALKQQIEGLVGVSSQQVVRRLPVNGPMAFGRGVEITLSLDESSFEGSGAFLFSGIMERFFRKYASINSFTETVVKTRERGEIMRWPMRLGSREVL